jgi:tRNA threonylcarbamoyladenosine biosynthesis protein TsaE
MITLHSESDSKRLAEAVARYMPGGQTIGLQGDLGAGKTTFVRYFVGALGGAPADVASPSYTLQNEYSISGHGPRYDTVEHWDLYRLQALPAELLEPPGAGVIRMVEWPDRVAGYADSLDLRIAIRVVESEAREVQVQGNLAEPIVKRFEEGSR